MPRIAYNIIEKHLSVPRLERYLLLSNGNKTKAVKLYKANLQVAGGFYPLLSVFEIVFRNSLNEILAAYFNDADWIINQQNGFMSDSSLSRRNFYLRTETRRAIQKIRQTGAAITSGKIIAEQTFGFWTALLEPHHFRLFRGRTLHAFPLRPHGYGRSDVLRELQKIQRFRNRTYHNEPICFANRRIDFSPAVEARNAILQVLSWIDTNLVKWIKDLDDIQDKIRLARQI